MVQPRSSPIHLIIQLLSTNHSKLCHCKTSTGATVPYANAWERNAVAQVAQQGVYRVSSSELAGEQTQSPCHIGVSPLEFGITHSEPILPPLLFLQVSVPGGAVAGRAAEQCAPLVPHGQFRPIKVREEAIEEGQSALESATLTCGLNPHLAGQPVGGEEIVTLVGLEEELPVAQVLHHTWKRMETRC